MSLRKTTLLTALLAFILLIFSSIIVYTAPQGEITLWANWLFLGLNKGQWSALHTNFGFLFIITGLLYILISLKSLIVYLFSDDKKMRIFTAPFNIALIISLFVFLFTILELPPLNFIQKANHSIKQKTAHKYGVPPYGYAETSSLKIFCKRTQIDLKSAIKALERANIYIESETLTLLEIGNRNNKTPQQIYQLIKPLEVSAIVSTQKRPFPEKPSFGFSRVFFKKYCEEVGLEPSYVINELKKIGIDAQQDDAMRDIAERNETESYAIFVAIRQIHQQKNNIDP